jgi:hypothetical protein
VFDFDEEEERVVLYDELTYFPPHSDLYELEIAQLDEVVPFGKPTIEYLQTLKRGAASGTQFPSMNPNVAVTQNPEYDSRPVSNKRDARRMSKSIVSGILQNAFRMQTSPDRIAEIPVDRMSSIPLQFQHSSVEQFSVPNYGNFEFEALVKKDRKDAL